MLNSASISNPGPSHTTTVAGSQTQAEKTAVKRPAELDRATVSSYARSWTPDAPTTIARSPETWCQYRQSDRLKFREVL
ncbi:MAG: hypothetical protein ACRDTD_11155, partial [Pseudonocardiaceae bacterium]